jgi:hypothetical protein
LLVLVRLAPWTEFGTELAEAALGCVIFCKAGQEIFERNIVGRGRSHVGAREWRRTLKGRNSKLKGSSRFEGATPPENAFARGTASAIGDWKFL